MSLMNYVYRHSMVIHDLVNRASLFQIPRCRCVCFDFEATGKYNTLWDY